MLILNGHEIKPTMFPDKTSQMWNLPDWTFKRKSHYMKWYFEAEREIMDIGAVASLTWPAEVELYVPFLPYARQDKEIKNDATFNLAVFADLLNVWKFRRVVAFDVHNEAAAKLYINRFENISPEFTLASCWQRSNPDYVVFPDYGAELRYGFITWKERVTFTKIRNQATGSIVTQAPNYPNSLKQTDPTFLIVDDICDGGATFINVATQLKRDFPDSKIDLYVSHGIFSKGKQCLHDAGIRNIFTTKSLPQNWADGMEI